MLRINTALYSGTVSIRKETENNIMRNNRIKYHFNIQDFNLIPCCGILLHQIGDLAFDEGGIWPEHDNTFYEFTYILEGQGVVYTGEHCCPVETGDCVLSIPGEKHSIVSSPGTPLRYAFTAFAEDSGDMRYAELFEELEKVSKQADSRCVRNPEMQKPLFHLIQEIQNDLPFQKIQLGNLLVDLIICYLRSVRKIVVPPFYNITDKMLLAYRIQDHLKKHFLEITKIGDLEDIFHYKYNSLELLFKNIYGLTISQYITNLKMEEAVQLLKQKVSVTRISEILQYSSIHSFTKSFRNHYGVPPSKYWNIKER